jgi:hypothetical protein
MSVEYLTCKLPFDDNSTICKQCQSHNFCLGVVNQEKKIWCGNCEYGKRTEEGSKDTIRVKIKCQYNNIPVWVHIDEENENEEEQRTLEFYKDNEKQYDDYGSDCLCHKLKEK